MKSRFWRCVGSSWRTLPRIVSAGLVVAVLTLSLGPARAQTPAPAPQKSTANAVSVDELERLVKTLESEPDRAKLVEQLKGLIVAQRGQPEEPPGLGETVMSSLSSGVERMTQTLEDIWVAVFDVRRVGTWLERSLNDEAERDRALRGTLHLLCVLALGIVAQVLVSLILRRMRRSITARQDGLLWRLGAGILKLVLDALPVAAFAAAAYGSLPFLDPAPSVRLLSIALVNAIVFSQALVLVAQLVLQPHFPSLRLLHLADHTAVYIYIWARRFIWLAVIGYVALEAARLLGLPRGAYGGLLRLLGLLIASLLVMVILQNRHAVAAWLKRGPEHARSAVAALRFRVADTWHVVAIVYVIGVYVVWVLRPGAGLQFLLRATLFSAAALTLGWLLERGLDRLIRRWFSVGDEFKTRYPELESRANRYLPVILSVARGLMAVATLLAILFIWGVTSFSILVEEPGRRIVLSLLRIGGIVIGGLVAWELGGLALERLLTRVTAKGRMPAARVQTMLPVARYIMGMVLVVIGAMMLLSEIGVEIGPLLAGAGVIGLAIGLGAQTLVKDLIAGFSLIMEDALAVGDVIKIGDNSGVVESLTIRTIRLRGFDGTVQTIPLGGVTVVENLTKDFSYAVIECGVAYKEDVDRVIGLLKEIGAEIQADPNFGDDILEPIEVVGLDKFQDSSLLIKARFKTYPIKQWKVLREFNRRMKARFDKEGIEIPFPYRTLTLEAASARMLADLTRPETEQQTPQIAPPEKS